MDKDFESLDPVSRKDVGLPPQRDPLLDYLRPQTTGNLLVTLEEGGKLGQAVDTLAKIADGKVVVTTLSENVSRRIRANGQTAVVFEDVGLAIIRPPEAQSAAGIIASLEQDEAISQARPEFYLFALQEFRDTTDATWGVAATRAATSAFTGKDIRVAVLDTGIDVSHPDLKTAIADTRSFVDGEAVDDLQGHGTHCAGTIAARAATPGIMRYGVAPDASLFIGKVLNNAGAGSEADILEGMQWAIESRCQIVSMSLGSPVMPGIVFNTVYERMAKRALASDTLFFAAAGNDSRRSFGFIAPVSSPADAPSIVAVGAVDPLLQPANFSNGGINAGGGEIDVVAPGVGIFSSAPRPRLHRIMDGTSMACPHAAGIAALWAESDPSLRGERLKEALTKNARNLPHNRRDVGHGLVQAP